MHDMEKVNQLALLGYIKSKIHEDQTGADAHGRKR